MKMANEREFPSMHVLSLFPLLFLRHLQRRVVFAKPLDEQKGGTTAPSAPPGYVPDYVTRSLSYPTTPCKCMR